MIRPEDDRFHPRTEDPFWNESSWFTLSVPERRIHGYVYFYFRPNMNLAAGGPLIFDPSGEDIYNCVYWDWDTTQAFPERAEMFDFQLGNSLRVETIALLKSYRFTYEKSHCRIDLRWDAIMEPHEMTRIGGEVNPAFDGYWSDSGAAELRTGHFDQGGRMRGTIDVEGEHYDVDAYSIRDRTWGPRRIYPARYGYDWAIHSEAASFFAASRSVLPADEDPIAGTTEKVTAGWYTNDGVTAALVAGERRITERDDEGRPKRAVIDAIDALGRPLHCEGRTECVVKWLAFSTTFCWVNLTSWGFDGREGWGELNDYYHFDMQRRFHKRLHRQRELVMAR
jgi:hypothetical protein